MTSLAQIAPTEPFDALIFDCDGTLADTMPNHYKAWTAALQIFGAQMSETRFYEMGGMPTAEMIRVLNAENGYDLDVAQTHDEKEQRYLEMMTGVTEIVAVADIARKYYGKKPMAVASGGIRRIVEQTLTATGLITLFDAIVTADDVLRGKPAPDIFLLAAEKMGVNPKNCIVYEDGDMGLEAARAAGMRGIDVRVLWREA